MKQFNLKEYLANPNRKVVTGDGRNVRIICTDAKGICPVVGLVAYENNEVALNATEDGRIDGVLDLFFAPKKREGWVNVYRGLGLGTRYCKCIFDSEEEALRESDTKAVATIKIEWEE